MILAVTPHHPLAPGLVHNLFQQNKTIDGVWTGEKDFSSDKKSEKHLFSSDSESDDSGQESISAQKKRKKQKMMS